MKRTQPYYTRIVAIYPEDVIMYYIDEQESTVEEFLMTIDKCFRETVKKKHRIFKQYDTVETDVELRVCKN